jgi:hypothetical protein
MRRPNPYAVGLVLALVLSGQAVARVCEWRCKVRFSACRIDQPKTCIEQEIRPDLDAGLCVFQSQMAVQSWINDRAEKDHVHWRWTVLECVTPDDSKV